MPKRILATLAIGFALGCGSIGAAAAADTAAPAASSSSDFAAKKQAFVAKAQAEYDEWKAKLAKANDAAEVKGSKLNAEAKAKLEQSWSSVKERWAAVKSASADGWEKARQSYEKATSELQTTWDKYRPLG